MRVVAVVCVLLSLPFAGHAGLIPILDITGGGLAAIPLADAVGGWQFTTNRAITVAALGLWDEGADGLSASHAVGLWTLTETLLRTAIVDNTSTPVASAFAGGRWLFTEIAPITLDPGTYVLGAVWGSAVFRIGLGPDPLVTHTLSGINLDGSLQKTLLPSPILIFPASGVASDGSGMFGPNLAVESPEPSVSLLLATAVLGMGLLRRKLARLHASH